MEIHETKIFLFTFKTDQGDVQFPMRAETKVDAQSAMAKTLLRMQAELAMESSGEVKLGTISASEEVSTSNIPRNISTSIPPEVLELRIDTLLGDMGAGALKGKAKADTIKAWTAYDFNENNYTEIITELELIQSGQKEIPAKKK